MWAFRTWYEEAHGEPLPNHWDFGLSPAFAVKAGAAFGIHCDHHDHQLFPAGCHSFSLGLEGYEGLFMNLPQLGAVAPFNDGESPGKL
jgi:hypothetical protein